jgi:hypothetical protein
MYIDEINFTLCLYGSYLAGAATFGIIMYLVINKFKNKN